MFCNYYEIWEISNHTKQQNMNYYFSLLALCLLITSTHSEKKLIFVQELFRHGARYPIYPEKNDKSQYAADLKSTGELTTQGKKMHYLLGQKVRQLYWDDLFKGTQYYEVYNQSKFYFRATDVNRTMESCQAHLMGIFEGTKRLEISTEMAKFSEPLWPDVHANEGPVFDTALDFHTLPIHVQRSYSTPGAPGDFLRAYTHQVCPKQDDWQTENQQDSLAKEIRSNPDLTQAVQKLQQALNESLSFSDAADRYDNYITTRYLGRETVPILSDPDYQRKYEYIHNLDMNINLFYTKKQVRPAASGFFGATIANIKRAVTKKDVQWVVYSAHDTTVLNMIAAMNMTNTACIYEAYKKGDQFNNQTCVTAYPGFTASVIFEAWQDTSTQQVTFMIRYEGKPRKIPFCNYELECKLSTLEKWYDENIYLDNLEQVCGIYDSEKQFYLGAAVLEFGVILVFLLIHLVAYLKGKNIEVTTKTEEKKRTVHESMLSEEMSS